MQGHLTARQLELLHALRSFFTTHQYAPSHRQLGKVLHCRHNAVQEILNQLERKGYVTRTPGVSRSLRIMTVFE